LLPRSVAPPHLPSFPTRRSSDLRAFTDLAARPQVRIRTDHRGFVDARAINHASGPDQDSVADLGIADHAIGTNPAVASDTGAAQDRKSTRLNSSHVAISYAVFCL